MSFWRMHSSSSGRRRLAHSLVGAAAYAALIGAAPVCAQEAETKIRGVNPADIDTRVDVIGKYNWLPGGASIFTTTLKFDYRVTDRIGVNVEYPALVNFRSPSTQTTTAYYPEEPEGAAPVIKTTGKPASNDWGAGDVFTRVRYIQPFGRISLGAALEAAFPAATRTSLGSGKYALNPTVLGVYAWSPQVISAAVFKFNNSVGGSPDRPNIRYVTLRGIQAFMFPNKMFVTLDVQRNWVLINKRDRWWETAAELGYQFSPTLVGSVRVGKKYGSRPDRGSVEMSVKNFF